MLQPSQRMVQRLWGMENSLASTMPFVGPSLRVWKTSGHLVVRATREVYLPKAT